MDDKLIAVTTETITFQRNTGTTENATEVIPAGTYVELDAYEMEENPDFFHVEIAGTGGRIHTYVSIDQVTCP